MKTILLLLFFVSSSYCWDNEEMELFDLVEEINKNFYEVMGIKEDASGQEVKRAFRNLSIVLHPDKSDAEDANIQFRNLVSIYEVLKDPGKRQKYDKVLREGLPNWKSALYYYRRVRKMGLAEMVAILFVIVTIGQYFVAWAVYAEKKYTAEQLFGSKLKKLKKKNKTNVDIDDILGEIPTPSIFNTLPFQIPLAIWYTPSCIKSFFVKLNEYKNEELEKRRREAEEDELQRQLEEELVKEREAKKEKKETIRKRKQAATAPEKTEEELAGYSRLKLKDLSQEDSIKPVSQSKPQFTGGFWTDEDLVELIRLVKKYPGGTAERWEIIAEAMSRSVPEVTFMAAKLKENGYRIPGHNESVAENLVQETVIVQKKVKQKKVANPILIPETNWSQEQQQSLEAAIVKYPKSMTTDRWQKISHSVPGKTKEECLVRYKYLVELVKSQKENKAKEDDEDENLPVSDQQSSAVENVQNARLEPSQGTKDDDEIDSNHFGSEDDEQNVEEVVEEPIVKKGGKPRNKRKERKKRMEFSTDEEGSD